MKSIMQKEHPAMNADAAGSARLATPNFANMWRAHSIQCESAGAGESEGSDSGAETVQETRIHNEMYQVLTATSRPS